MLFERFGVSSLYSSWLELRQDSLESFGLQDRLSRIFMGASSICHRILPSFRRSCWCWGAREWRVLVPFPGMVPAAPAPLQCSKICVFENKIMLFARFGASSLYLSWPELRQDSLESFGLQDPFPRLFMGASWSFHRIRASFRRSRWCWGSRVWLHSSVTKSGSTGSALIWLLRRTLVTWSHD